MNKLIIISLAILLSISSLAQAASSPLVKLEYNVPENIAPGESVTTTIRVIAKTDLRKLVISASPYSNLLLLSGGNNIEFTDLNRGDSREFEVTIQLDGDIGYLAMAIAATSTSNRERLSSQAIRYGSGKKATGLRMKSQYLIEDSSGEKLILMPVESN